MCRTSRSVRKEKLRQFLFSFALEEEPHFKVAESDLRNMGLTPMKMPLDVALWWAYFDRIVEEKPFVRLGTTCVLENLGAGAGPLVRALFEKTNFLDKKNTRFLEIHLHEILPPFTRLLMSRRMAITKMCTVHENQRRVPNTTLSNGSNAWNPTDHRCN